MGFIIVLALVFILTTVFVSIKEYWFAGLGAVIVGLAFATILTFLAAIVLVGLNFLPSSHYELSEQKQITSLTDSKELNGYYGGSFLVGTGSIDEELFYYYAEVDESGYTSVNKVEMNRTKFKEVDGEPKLMVYEKVYDGKIAKFFYGENPISFKKYKMQVPKNTIKTQWNLDME